MKAKEIKKQRIEELIKEAQNYKNLAVVSLYKTKGKLQKKMREKLSKIGKVCAGKKVVLLKLLERLGVKADIKEPFAVILTNKSPYDIYWEIADIKEKRYARPREIAESDIEVADGETSLPPGPVLSELKVAGLDARVQGGKIVIAKPAVIARKGEVIKEAVAKALQKLNVMPFYMRIKVLYGFDGSTLFTGDTLSLSKEDLMAGIIASQQMGNSLSAATCYYTDATIRYAIAKAGGYEKAISAKIDYYNEGSIKLKLALGSAYEESLKRLVK
ncbi:MAG: hypothetical protein QW035_02545 [Candidatus Anstonellales archaeon]